MDLLQIGSQCSHSSCDQIDFLPILCRCSKYFCRHHITSYRHSCPIDLAANDPTTGLFHNIQRCAINTCGKPSLNVSNSNDSDLKNACPQCRKSFCAVHRHPSSHSCQVADAPKSQRSASARALLAKNFPVSSGKKAAPQRTINVPIKLPQHRKAELIKMRHQAAPGNPVDNSYTPQDQRLHLRLYIDKQTEKVFWFRKTTITGKVLDCLASHIKSSVSPPLRLLKASAVQEGKCVLPNDRAIVDNVEDGELLVVAGHE